MDFINLCLVVLGVMFIVKELEYFFFDLLSFEGMLKEWICFGLL